MCTSQVLYQIEVPWDTYLPSGILGDRELQLVRRYDKAAKETQAQLLQVRRGAPRASLRWVLAGGRGGGGISACVARRGVAGQGVACLVGWGTPDRNSKSNSALSPPPSRVLWRRFSCALGHLCVCQGDACSPGSYARVYNRPRLAVRCLTRDETLALPLLPLRRLSFPVLDDSRPTAWRTRICSSPY